MALCECGGWGGVKRAPRENGGREHRGSGEADGQTPTTTTTTAPAYSDGGDETNKQTRQNHQGW
eukprot:2964921-Rhodomonas_salina.3